MLHLKIQVCEKKIFSSKTLIHNKLYHLCIYTFHLCVCDVKVEVYTEMHRHMFK